MNPSSPVARIEVAAIAAAVTPPVAGIVPDLPDLPDAHLRGLWLVLARVGWATLAALIVACCLANLPAYLTQLHTVCLHAPCAPWQLTPARARALEQFHVAPTSYALMSLVVSVSALLVWFAVAAFIAWRRSRQWLALLTSLLLLAQGPTQLSGSVVAPLDYSAPAWHLATSAVVSLDMALYLLVFALFPTGRFVPGWMRWVVAPLVPAVFWAAISSLASSVPFSVAHSPLDVVMLYGIVGGISAAQVYRYRRVSAPVERQQTKWIVLGVIAGSLVGVVYFSLPVYFPALGQPDSLYYVLAKPAYNVLWLCPPLCFGIAILRYRLWDIDLLIRRTLVYGTLTALLAAVYAGLVIGAQAMVRAFTGQIGQQPAVIVASTLLVAALFTPLRHGIQAFIDQRFYRHKYDAAKTVAAFSATLRSEVELAQVREQLLAVVAATMQPAHVSLWLRAPPPQRGTPDAQPPTGAPLGSGGPSGNVQVVYSPLQNP
jgi:hypothetical protein